MTDEMLPDHEGAPAPTHAVEPRFSVTNDGDIRDRSTDKSVHYTDVVDLMNELEQDLQEWARVAELQHNTLASYADWPPKNPQGCGWCIRAAGDTKEARQAVEKFDIDGVRAHAMTCPHNEAVNAAVEQIAAWFDGQGLAASAACIRKRAWRTQ